MSQTIDTAIDPDTVSGTALATKINNATAAFLTQHSGTARPSYAQAGTIWYKTTNTSLYFYDGASDIFLGTLDVTNHIWNPPVGGGQANLASASTCDLGSVSATSLSITGTTSITAFGNTMLPGNVKFLTFAAALTLTHDGTNLKCPGGQSITTAAGDRAIVKCIASGSPNSYEVVDYIRASNAFVDVASASTTNIGAAACENVRITGTTTITAFDNVAAGVVRKVRFASALTLTYNATSLILPGLANITTAADDSAEIISLGSGNWMVRDYQSSSCVPSANNIRAIASGLVNKCCNAGLDVWPNGTSGTITAGTPGYTAEGWIVGCTGANVTWAQVAGRNLTAYALKATGAASVTDILFKHRMESLFAFALAGQTVTVQAKIYNNTGSSITPTLTVKRAGSTDNYTSPTTDVNAVSLQACPNTTLTTVAYTFAANAGAGTGLEFTIDCGNNFSTTGKSVEISELDVRVTPGVATGLNSNPPSPEIRPIAIELPICQRYFRSSFPQGTTPSQNAGTTGAVFCEGHAASAPACAAVQFIPPMRTTPSITTFNPSANNANWRNTTAGSDINVGSPLGTSDSGMFLTSNTQTLAQYATAAIHYTANARL